DTLLILRQTADRSLSVYAAIPTDFTSGGGMAVGDLDGNGKADIVVPGVSAIDVFKNIAPTTEGPTISIPRAGATSVAIAPVDADGLSDIVAVGSFGARVYWGADGFSTVTATPLTSVPVNATVAVGDVSHHSNSLLDV